MKNKKIFSYIIIGLVIITLILSFIRSAFIPSFMLMLALYLFSECFIIMNDNDKKKKLYVLFSIGVILIVGSLIYTFMRIL